MKLAKIELKDVLYIGTLVVGVAMAYASLSTKVQAQSEAIKAIPTLAEQVGRLAERVDSLKESIVDLKREIKRR